MQSCNVPVVSHKKTGSAFAFDFEEHESSGRRQRYSVRRPGTESAMETIQAQSWNEQMNHVREWLLLIRRELNPAGFQPPLEKTARLGPGPDSWPSSSSSNIMIFISHSSADATMAEALADLLRTALSIPPERIRCTSAIAYSLQFGIDTAETLRAEVSSADVVIGLITPSSTESHWVLFELGARWGQGKALFSVLAGGADYNLLPEPIRNLHALRVTDRAATDQAAVVKFVEELASQLQITRPESWRYTKFVERFVSSAQQLARATGEGVMNDAASDLERFKARYRYEESVCWKYEDVGKREGPFCPNCVDEGMERRLNPGATRGTYSCVKHRAQFWTAEMRPAVRTGRIDRA